MDMVVTGSVIAAVVLALCVWLYLRFMRSQDDGRDDRFSPERILTTEQVAMLDYLQDTFPGQVVLPNVSLGNMLSVRRAANKAAAKQRLKEHRDMIGSIKRGDTVVTSGGIVGKVTRLIGDAELQVEIAENVRVRVIRGTVSEVRTRGDVRDSEARKALARADNDDDLDDGDEPGSNVVGALALGDVGVGAKPPYDLAVLVPNGQGVREEPAVLPVAAAQGEGVFPGLAGFPGALDAFHHPVHMRGVVDGGPAPPLHLLEGGAGVVVPALVVPEDPARGVSHPGELRDVVGEDAEAFFALSQRRLGAGAFDGGPGTLGDLHEQRFGVA